MSYDLWTSLEVGEGSRRIAASAESRNFRKLVHQATRDFGAYLASAEDRHDLEDRILQVEAELREAGVDDPTSVLEAVAAAAGDDEDVPDFVDTDENDDKDRDDEADSDDSDDKDRKESKVAFGEQPGQPIAGQIPGASQHPVVPRMQVPGAGVPGAAPGVTPQIDPANQPQPPAQQILGSKSALPFKARIAKK